jgi:hypothetical protein
MGEAGTLCVVALAAFDIAAPGERKDVNSHNRQHDARLLYEVLHV